MLAGHTRRWPRVKGNVDSCSTDVCTFAPTANFENPTNYASAVLWNFVNATNLNFTTEFGGSILAPDATVDNSASPGLP